MNQQDYEDCIFTKLSLRQAKAIARLLKNEWISYEDHESREAVDYLFKFVDDHELGRTNSSTTQRA